MRHSRRHPSRPEPTDQTVRARRLLRRGDVRKAFLTMRSACYEDANDPKLWAQFGHCARLSGKLHEAFEAFTHAAWLFERRRDAGRASALRDYLARLGHAVA